jgi:hypothetical protein
MSGGTFTKSTGNVNFNGNVAQTIPNGSYSFNNIQINNTSAAGATFGDAVSTSNISGDITVGNINPGSLLNTNNLSVTRGYADALIVSEGSTLDAGTTSIYWNSTGGSATIGGTFRTSNLSGFSGSSSTAIRSNYSPAITLGANSTVEYDSPNGGQTVTSRTYVNLRMSNTSGTQTAGGNLTVNGVFTTVAGGTLNLGTYLLSGTLSAVANGGIIQSQNMGSTPIPPGKVWGGGVQYNASTGGQTVVPGTYNNLILSNSSGTQVAGGALTVNGTLTTTSNCTFNLGANQLSGTLAAINNGGTIQTQNSGPVPVPPGKTWAGTFQYNAAAGGQSIAGGTYNNLTLSNTSGTQTASGNLIVDGTLTTSLGGILNMGTNQLSGILNQVVNGGIIQTQNISSSAVPSGKSWGGTIQYNALSGGQTVMSGIYNNLTLSNTSGTQTAGGNLTVNGTLATALGGVLNLKTYQLLGTVLTISNLGTIQTQNTGSTPIPSGKTWGGTVQYNSTTGAQTGMAGTYNNLIIDNTTGVTLSNAVIVSNILTLSRGKLTTGGVNLLSITNSNVAAISGGSATSFINGPLRRALPANLGPGTTYNFPVGKGSVYLPFVLVNPTTGAGTVTVQTEAFATGSGGTSDETLTSISNMEYWSLITSGSFTGSSVSLSRPTSISPLDVIAGSVTSTGIYSCLEGTANSNGVSGSDAIQNFRFFALAAKKPVITTVTITGAPFCAGTNGVSIPFTYTPKANFAGATFTAQLSNTSGSFTSPVSLGSVSSNGTGSQSLNVTIPPGTPTGTGYRIRIVSNSPAVAGSDNGSDIIVSSGIPSQPGVISGSATPCANTAGITYSVPNVNGVSYKWTFPTGWTQTDGGNTNSVTVTTGSTSGNIQVVPYNACGDGTARTMAAGVIAGPAITVQPSSNPQSICQNSPTATLSISATGTGLTYQWYKNVSGINSGGTLLPGANSPEYTPSSSSIGTSYYYCAVTGNCAPPAISQVSGAVTVVVPQLLIPVPASRCGSGTVSLSVIPSSCISSTVSWFSTMTGGTSLGTGNSFTTPAISSTTTYYAQENFIGGLFTLGSGYSSTNNAGLTFDLNEPIILNSVQVRSSSSGTITIALQDNDGNLISSVNQTLTSGVQTVNLGWTIPAGNGYRIVKTAGYMSLYRTDAYSSWPVGFDVGSITGSIEGGNKNSSRYDFFYNWNISRARVGVTAIIGPPIVSGFSGSRCGPGTVVLRASATAGTISWFTSLTGGSPVATGNSYSPNLSSTTTYYVQATDGSCTSSPRVRVIASIITPPSITASGGGTFCAGSDVILTSMGTNLSNRYWTGPNSFYSLLQNPPALTNVTPGMSGTYTVTGSALSNVNLVSNGDFESGNTGFGSAYIFNGTDLWDEGTYAVVADPHSVHANFVSDGDHTSGSGKQMVVNGASVANVNVWSQTVNVVPNTDYQYTYWIQSVVENNPAQLQLYINGSPAGPVYTADVVVNSWRQFTYNWNSGSSTTAYLSLVNQNITPNANDFALDDIVFQQTCEASASVVVTVNNEVTAGTAGTMQSICPGNAPATLTSITAGTGSGTISYEWQTNATGSYITIEGAVSSDYSPPPLASTTSYRRRTVSQSNGITCYSPYTTPVTITITSGPTAVAGGPDTVCQSNSPLPLTLTGAGIGGTATTGAWSILSGGGSLSDYSQTGNPAEITYTPAADYNGQVILRLTTNNTGCAAVSDRIINITPAVGTPTAISIVAGSEPTCQLTNGTTSTTYATTATDNTGFTWSVSDNAAGSIGASTGIMTWANGFNGSVNIQVTANGCNGPSNQIIRSVTVVPTVGSPLFDLGASSNRCQGEEVVTYGATATNSADIAYTLDAVSLAAGNRIDSSTGEVTYSADWTGTSTITASVTGCNGPKTATHIITTIPDGSWTGAIDDDWNNPGNWACGQLPSLTSNVLIANGKAHYPIVSNADATCKNLTIQSSSSVIVDGNTLQIAGTINNSGTFTASSGVIEMAGTGEQIIPTGAFKDNTIMDLNINNPSGVTLDGPLNITGVVRPYCGIFNSGEKKLTLVSTASQTALIDGEGSGDVLGTVIMQRYLLSGFGYKYFSSPFQSATVGQFSPWVNLNAAFPTFYSYDENNKSSTGEAMSGWVKYVNPSGLLIPMHGYSANFGTIPSAVTMSLSGTVNNGSLGQLTLTNHNMTYTDGFNLIGNPYPSPIDWNSPSLVKTNVDEAIYFFNASSPGNKPDSLQYEGTYSSYVNDQSTTGGPTNFIPAMQAFFVRVSTTSPVGSITFNNGCRVSDLHAVFKSAHFTYTPLLRLKAGFDGNFSDPAVIYFNDFATPSFDGKLDALKMMNTDHRVPNLYFKSADSKNLSINAIPFPTDSITRIPLGLRLSQDGRISLEIADSEQMLPGYRIYLEDSPKGIYTELRSNQPYYIPLKAGIYENRFSIVFSLKELTSGIPGENDKFVLVPTGGIWVVNLKLGTTEKGILQLTNMSGQVLFKREVMGAESIELDYKGDSGVYLISLISGREIFSKKVIIQK